MEDMRKTQIRLEKALEEIRDVVAESYCQGVLDGQNINKLRKGSIIT